MTPTLARTHGRVDALLARMTLREKIGQMTQAEKNSATPDDVRAHALGSVLSGGGGNPEPNTPAAWRAMVLGFREAALESRLGIPLIYGVDAVHGHNNVVGATIFPHNVGLGAIGDADLVRRIARATAREVAATGVRWTFAPAVSVPVDVRWGRTYEGYGQDPDLVGRLAAAYVDGLRGIDWASPDALLPSVKHYLADGGARLGTSTRWDRAALKDLADDPTLANARLAADFLEVLDRGAWTIDQGDVDVDERTLREVFLAPYRAALAAGALNVMASYGSWHGRRMHEHRTLLTDVLKGELGFEGFVVSDWAGIDQLDPDLDACVERAINAGIDMVMVPFDWRRFMNALEAAVERGAVPLARVDDAVRRILTAKERLGLFDAAGDPDREPPLGDVGHPDHRRIAQEAARRSPVLLQNRGDALPLPPTLPALLVAGAAADDVGLQCGGWTISWMGAAGPDHAGHHPAPGAAAVASRRPPRLRARRPRHRTGAGGRRRGRRGAVRRGHGRPLRARPARRRPGADRTRARPGRHAGPGRLLRAPRRPGRRRAPRRRDRRGLAPRQRGRRGRRAARGRERLRGHPALPLARHQRRPAAAPVRGRPPRRADAALRDRPRPAHAPLARRRGPGMKRPDRRRPVPRRPRSQIASRAVAARLAVLALVLTAPWPAASQAGAPPYLDARRSIEARVDDLLGRMTLDEKLGQMALIEKGSIDPAGVARLGIGAVLSGGGGYPPGDNTVAGWRAMVAGYQEAALRTRLAIPVLYGVDAVHGHASVVGAVVFPHNVGLGAAANPDLVEAIARATAREMLATGIPWNYAPVLAVPRDVRWGRTYEGYGEDPELVTRLALAALRGLQGDDLAAPGAVLATPKHFVGDGATAFGTSPIPGGLLDRGDADVDEATLRRVHLAPYVAAVAAGARSVMVSFSSWGGLPLHAHAYLIRDVLREELGFTGFVVSDWAGVDEVSADYDQAVVASVNAGIDLVMVPYEAERFLASLRRAVERGHVEVDRIDEAVAAILRVKFELGLFERPYGDPALQAEVGSDAHRALARDAVAQTLVLLKNADGALPLQADAIETVLVTGSGADSIGVQSGGWTIEWQGSTASLTPGTTILEGLEAGFGAGTTVRHDPRGRFLDGDGQPLRAEVGIAVVAEPPYAEWFGDSADLALPVRDRALVETLRAQVDTLIVVVLSGRPVVLDRILEVADAVVAAWLPGSEGDGVSDVLFGVRDFNGTLPYTWPRTAEQLPFDLDALATDGPDAPLFARGYGLRTADTDRAVANDAQATPEGSPR